MTRSVLMISNSQELRDVLKRFNINRKGWLKTRRQLLGQIKAGECVLAEKSGELTRFAWRSQADVFRVLPNGARQRLVEVERVVNGIRREPSSGPSVSEKRWAMKGENPLDAMQRGIHEELGILIPLAELIFVSCFVDGLAFTKSFPLRSQSCVHFYECVIPFEQTKEEYVESLDRKYTRWEWR